MNPHSLRVGPAREWLPFQRPFHPQGTTLLFCLRFAQLQLLGGVEVEGDWEMSRLVGNWGGFISNLKVYKFLMTT